MKYEDKRELMKAILRVRYNLLTIASMLEVNDYVELAEETKRVYELFNILNKKIVEEMKKEMKGDSDVD